MVDVDAEGNFLMFCSVCLLCILPAESVALLWSLPRSQQDQAPMVHRSNLQIFWLHVRTWSVSYPVRRGQRRAWRALESVWTEQILLH